MMQALQFAPGPLPPFKFDGGGWDVDEPLKREWSNYLHVGLINPNYPSARIELREYIVENAAVVHVAEVMRARFVPDEIFDVTFDDTAMVSSSSFRVGDFVVMQTTMGFDVADDRLVVLDFQLTSLPAEYNDVRPPFMQMLATVEISK